MSDVLVLGALGLSIAALILVMEQRSNAAHEARLRDHPAYDGRRR